MLRLFLSKCKAQTTLIKTHVAFHNFTQSLRFICIGSNSSSSSSRNGIETIHNNNNNDSLTVSFLKNSLGLYAKSCTYASLIARLETSDKPNSVLQFFRSRGLSQSQIHCIIIRVPPILLSNVGKTLKPKIDFFLSLGLSETDLNKMISMDPQILTRSLKSQLAPSFEILKTITGSQGNALTAMKRYPRVVRQCRPKYLEQNVTTLRNFNVPCSRVSQLVMTYPSVIIKPPHRFSKVVLTVKEMGFDPSCSMFIRAVIAMARINDLRWNKKFENFRNSGFSDYEILSMFKKQPRCMMYSEGRMKSIVDFYVNKMHWSPLQLSLRPQVLQFSLEKRIIPRCSVVQVLWSRNKFGKSRSLTTILNMTEKNFFQKYVTRYKDEALEVLDAYQDHKILSMFKKQPLSMLYSEGRMKGIVDFYVNKLHWSPLQLSLVAYFLQFSLEKRIVPRCSVLQVLWSRNKLGKSPMPTTIVSSSDKNFLWRYVTKYEDEIPEVLDAFQGKLKFDEYNFVLGGG